MTARWFCARIQPNMQATAEWHLRRQGRELFSPKIERRPVGKSVPVTELMFRGYGFLEFDHLHRWDKTWRSINGTRGVVGLLPLHAEAPLPMPVGFVEQLKDNDPLREEDLVSAFDDYFPGVEVEVQDTKPLLSGRRGLVVAVRTKLLQVSLAGMNQDAWLDKADVVPTYIPTRK